MPSEFYLHDVFAGDTNIDDKRGEVMAGDKVFVDEFERNSMEVVRVHLQKFPGNENRYIDVRVFALERGGSNEAAFEGIATRKGITIRIDLLDRLIEALNRARLELEDGEE